MGPAGVDISEHEGLVRRVVASRGPVPDDVREDMLQAGRMALVEAALTWDPQRGSFANWAWRRLHAAVIGAQRAAMSTHVGRRVFEARARILRAGLSGRDPAEVAAVLGYSPDLVRLADSGRHLHTSLDAPATAGGDGATVGDLVADDGAAGPEDLTVVPGAAGGTVSAVLAGVLRELWGDPVPAEVALVAAHRLCDGDRLTVAELVERTGLGHNRIRRLEAEIRRRVAERLTA